MCPMALPKFSKPKTFHVDYCGCTAATLLLDESSIRYAINLIRQAKPKREFVRTSISISKDGVNIIYDNDQKFATHVPSAMIAGSNIGKSSLCDTVGVVYISPLTGQHYPAFVHVYRCDSSRTAQKLLARFRAYTLVESHRLQLVQLEQQLLDNNLLNINQYNTSKVSSQSPNTTINSTKTNTAISSSSTSSGSRQEKVDPVKSITEEFQKKIDSQEPILFPPKDYDTEHTAHGNIQRAQAWKSTEPTIVGYTSIDSDNSRIQRQTHTTHQSSNHNSTTNGIKKSELNNGVNEKNGRPGYSTQKSDTTIDPLETVSLAFDFLKDETGSIVTENDGNIEHLGTEEHDKPPVFRFRPPQMNAITKKIFPRNNNYELSNSYHQSQSPSKNNLNDYYNNTHYQHQQMPVGYRTRSETNLHYDPQAGMHLSPRYESRLANGSGAPISTNPLWTSPMPTIIGSQPNLSKVQSSIVQARLRSHLSPTNERRMTSVPLQHPLYASYPNNKSIVTTQPQENEQKRPAPPPPPPPMNSHKKQTTQLQYLDTHEFILRASDGQLMTHSQHSSRPAPGISREYRPHSFNVNGNSGTMLDVYY